VRWPWSRAAADVPGVETRESATDQIVAQLLAEARNAARGDWRRHGAVVTAEGVWARAGAVGDVAPTLPALTPGVLARIFGELVTAGESVWRIGVDRARGLVLTPATIEAVDGGVDPSTWTYTLTQDRPLAGATIPERVRLPAASVLHCRINASPPWRGRSPFTVAGETAQLAANVERSLGEESGTVTGYVLPLPEDPGEAPEDGEDDGDDRFAGLTGEIASMRGNLVIAETTAGGWTEGRANAPRGDWTSQRFGPSPPEPLVTLRADVLVSMLAVAGIQPALVLAATAGAEREAIRRFLFSTLSPTAAIVAAELEEKLDLEGCTITFDRLGAADITGRARAYASLVNAEMDPERAARVAQIGA